MVLPLLPTSLVGSCTQPEWLIDRKKLAARFPPRVRARELWRVAPELLEQAQDDATLIAIRDQGRAGLDIITDGEMRRESYSNRFATALDGVDIDNPGTALDRSGHPNPVPRIFGNVRRKHPPICLLPSVWRSSQTIEPHRPHDLHWLRGIHIDGGDR
jgi:5-methyltetrahydropteroyltriglutamate--homocysteine methyltransferase